MATIVTAGTVPGNLLVNERRFFLIMALAIAVTVIIGFAMNLPRIPGGFGSMPVQVHLHGAVFATWILFYVLQNTLVAGGQITLHRSIGWIGAVLAVLMVILGITTTIMAIEEHRVPFFFPPGIFLMLDVLGIIGFGGLTASAIVLRRRPAWHKRLMLCGTILVMSPALGRILPMPLLGKFAAFAVFVAMALYVIAGMLFDLRTRGRIHPAYYWGGGVLALTQALIGPLGFSPPVLRLVAQLAA